MVSNINNFVALLKTPQHNLMIIFNYEINMFSCLYFNKINVGFQAI